MKEKEKTEQDPMMQWYEVYNHNGEAHWSEMRNVSELSSEEYYELWEGDRI